ncbi:MAG: 6-phosphogluconolactonase, partial [bacterium]
KVCEEVILVRGKINVALSGGNTPKALFTVLSVGYKNKIDWSKVNFFWVDERCVPATDEESNFGMTKKFLLDNIAIPEENVHRVFGNHDPVSEAERYSEDLTRHLPAERGYPRFDLIILGMGDDGHTASIFPDRMDLFVSEKLCDVVEKPANGQKRITFTGNIIDNAERIYFLVTGKNKAEIVKKILNEEGDYYKYPAAHVQPADGEIKWYLDKAAAESLV